MILRLPWTISLMRRGGTPMAIARRCCVMPKGSRYSSISTSPGWIGGMVVAVVTSFLSVVVDQFDIFGASVGPLEADPPLLVDTNAVRAGAVALQLFESIARRDPQVAENLGSVEDQQLSEGDPLSGVVKPSDPLPPPDPFGLLLSERPDHITDSNE